MRLRLVAGWMVVLCAAAGAQTKRALLIGIDTYQPAGTTAQHPAGCIDGRCELPAFQNLQGAVNDARMMVELLTGPKFGFPKAQVVALTRPEQTTHDAILAAMQRYLVDVPQRGDTVVFYDASHGSLRVNSKGNKMAVLVNGNLVHVDSTLVPSDAYKGVFDVRDREMTRIFNAALDKGVRLTVIFDSCHSGGATRGMGRQNTARALTYDPRDVNEAPDGQPAPTERADNPALVFAAAQQDQFAQEGVASGETHGAFTAALVQALETLPADAPAGLVYSRENAALEGGSVGNQDPELDAGPVRRTQPLFGGAKADDGKVMAAALKMDTDGVWLDIGRAAGVGVGSEFVSSSKDSKGYATTLRVTAMQGIARSSAQVVSPPGAKVAAGDLFTLTKWVPAESDPLLVWTGPAITQDALRDVVVQVRASGATLVGDPVEETWTDVLAWDGMGWSLRHVDATSGAVNLDKGAAPFSLGAKLTASALKEHLSGGAKLWADLPLMQEMAAALASSSSGSAVQSAPDAAHASYLLTGSLTANGPVYAWMRAAEMDAGPPAATKNQAKNHTAGCSATSQYPTRSDWSTDAAALNQYSERLAKVHGWLSLADNPVGAAAGSYYTLWLLRAGEPGSSGCG